MKYFIILFSITISIACAQSDSIGYPSFGHKKCSICFSDYGGIEAGAGLKTFHIGLHARFLYLDVNGNYKPIGPDPIMKPFSWFLKGETKDFIRLGTGIGINFKTFFQILFSFGSDLTWCSSYTAWTSSVTRDIWWTKDRTVFKVGWFGILLFPVLENLHVGIACGDLRDLSLTINMHGS